MFLYYFFFIACYNQQQSYWLGTYDTIEQATKARRIAEEKIYGNFIQWYLEDYPGIREKIVENNKEQTQESKSIP